jgi:hypothetical protein
MLVSNQAKVPQLISVHGHGIRPCSANAGEAMSAEMTEANEGRRLSDVQNMASVCLV